MSEAGEQRGTVWTPPEPVILPDFDALKNLPRKNPRGFVAEGIIDPLDDGRVLHWPFPDTPNPLALIPYTPEWFTFLWFRDSRTEAEGGRGAKLKERAADVWEFGPDICFCCLDDAAGDFIGTKPPASTRYRFCRRCVKEMVDDAATYVQCKPNTHYRWVDNKRRTGPRVLLEEVPFVQLVPE